MTKFNEALLESMLELVKARSNPDAVKVVAYEEVQKSDGYCETCYYEYTEVKITYLTSSGETSEYGYSGSFAELIRDLTNGYFD